MSFIFKEFITDAEREKSAQIIIENNLFFSEKEMEPGWFSGSKCLVTNNWEFLPNIAEPVSNNFIHAIIVFDNDIAIAQCLVSQNTPYMFFDNTVSAYVKTEFRKQGICEKMINMVLHKYPETIDYQFKSSSIRELLASC